MTNDELNHFLDHVGRDEESQQVIHTTAMTAVAALEELQRVFNDTMSSTEITPKYTEVNRWGETELEYQMWKSKMAIESLALVRTPASKMAMLYFWNQLVHKFNEEPQEIEFRVHEVARDLRLNDKGFRDLIPYLMSSGLFRRESRSIWTFIGEPVMRGIDDAIEEHLTTA